MHIPRHTYNGYKLSFLFISDFFIHPGSVAGFVSLFMSFWNEWVGHDSSFVSRGRIVPSVSTALISRGVEMRCPFGHVVDFGFDLENNFSPSFHLTKPFPLSPPPLEAVAPMALFRSAHLMCDACEAGLAADSNDSVSDISNISKYLMMCLLVVCA